MKLLLLSLFLAGAGAGWYGLAPSADETTACESEDCRVTVECTDRGTCIVTCYDANGEVRCREEVSCDEPCSKTCDEPSDSSARTGAGKACVPGPACGR